MIIFINEQRVAFQTLGLVIIPTLPTFVNTLFAHREIVIGGGQGVTGAIVAASITSHTLLLEKGKGSVRL